MGIQHQKVHFFFKNDCFSCFKRSLAVEYSLVGASSPLQGEIFKLFNKWAGRQEHHRSLKLSSALLKESQIGSQSRPMSSFRISKPAVSALLSLLSSKKPEALLQVLSFRSIQSLSSSFLIFFKASLL